MATGEVYKITNNINGKIYIGQVVSYTIHGEYRGTARRIKEHIRDWNRKNALIIDKAIKKYGFENFSVEIICVCPLDQIDEIETEQIRIHNSTDKRIGYNRSPGGKGLFTEETKQKISSILKEKWDTDTSLRENASATKTEFFQDADNRRKMADSVRKTVRAKMGSSHLPDYISVCRAKGVEIGYICKINYLKKSRKFASKKLTMEEKLKLAINQVELWKKELGLL